MRVLVLGRLPFLPISIKHQQNQQQRMKNGYRLATLVDRFNLGTGISPSLQELG